MTRASSNRFTRRQAIAAVAAGAAANLVTPSAWAADATAAALSSIDGPVIKNNRINQTICAWCYKKWKLDELCQVAVKLGYRGIDLVGPGEGVAETLKKYNLTATMCGSHSIPKGLNRKENWEECLAKIRKGIDFASANGFPNVICFSGNRDKMADDEGAKNCVEALKQIVGYAEEKKVTINMELLNSRVNHPDYMCDHSAWGVGVVKAVGSERFKLLYDIYHMQIMEGDVIATIERDHECFGHYHTGGVPGRHEIDDTQELNYAPIMRAIVKVGYKGWVGQEFIPAGDPLAGLTQAGRVCDV